MACFIFYCITYCQVNRNEILKKNIFIILIKLISYSGVNKSDVADYPRVSEECAFFNNKFLIFSSLGSFFIPCIIIFAIYYRILMVIMARARKNRKQWRPKAAIQSAAAQHRTNVNHLVTSLRHDPSHSIMNNDTNTTFNSTMATKSTLLTNETVPLTNNPGRNVLKLQLSTPTLSPGLRASINVTSSSGDQIDDDERDDIALFVHHEQQEKNRKNKKDEHANQIEILPSTTSTSNARFADPTDFQTTTRSSQTENNLHSHYPDKHFKTRLKTKTSTDGLPITKAIIQTNNTKIAKRKVYSRMKKERKATQTLIIVLSTS
jgi:dopamine D2-like receptor